MFCVSGLKLWPSFSQLISSYMFVEAVQLSWKDSFMLITFFVVDSLNVVVTVAEIYQGYTSKQDCLQIIWFYPF